MEQQVTLVYLNWKRGKQLSNIIVKDALKQSLIPQIVIIDNSASDPEHKLEEIENVTIIPADNSVQCWARWEYITKNVTTPYVCVMDDDLTFTSPNILLQCYSVLEAYPEVDAVGLFGVLLNSDLIYTESLHLHGNQNQEGVFVDIIKGRFVFLRTSKLATLDMTPDLTCDDIKVSSTLDKKVIIPMENYGFRELADNDAVSLRPDHAGKRNQAAKKYFSK